MEQVEQPSSSTGMNLDELTPRGGKEGKAKAEPKAAKEEPKEMAAPAQAQPRKARKARATVKVPTFKVAVEIRSRVILEVEPNQALNLQGVNPQDFFTDPRRISGDHQLAGFEILK